MGLFDFKKYDKEAHKRFLIATNLVGYAIKYTSPDVLVKIKQELIPQALTDYIESLR